MVALGTRAAELSPPKMRRECSRAMKRVPTTQDMAI
jgi:hypothetical protein